MCLGIPGKLEAVFLSDAGMRMGQVSFGGVKREVCLDFVPEAEVGQYVLVHVGFALSCMNEAEAEETLSLLRQMGEVGEETVDHAP